ncbi:microtubule-actin cross-linking factor 1-like protein [Leptotrombidium deliense]|uniref:Microtubule-actin cross-linking factor 1-like protein n=1 Tax=Leptotrombidium deliense TaxID=299467 RepID=A0A443SKE8_9ACAR|nr:microtubule-actin cross-linking factor 1-like protein [Leptotrombidium deliense]
MTSKLKTLVTTKETSVASRLYETVAEHKHSIEDTSAAGSRFIREAKLYDMQCKTYNETLEKIHPSLDASLKRKTGKRTSGSDVVQEEIDNLNQEYNNLLEAIRQQVLGEAFTSAEKWLSETEAMVAHQKPISADYNIAKTQLNEQRSLMKTVSDRQNSFAQLENLGKEMAASMEYRERAQVEKQLNNLSERFETLINNVQRRLQQLEETVPTARQFAERYGPLLEWLDQSEHKLRSISAMPTDQETLRQRMSEHRILRQDIIDHKHDFETLAEVANNLITLVGDDEAQGIVDKLSAITDRYARLCEEIERISHMLNDAQARLIEEENEKSLKTLMNKFTDVAENIHDFLSERERILKQRVQNPIPRDRGTLENLILEHKEFEMDLQSVEPKLEEMKERYHNIPKKNQSVQAKYESIMETWERIWNLSNLYIERLNAVEIVIVDIEEATNVVSTLEAKLLSQEEVPGDEVSMKRLRNELIEIQNEISRSHGLLDQLNMNTTKVRRTVEKTRPKQTTHSDVARLEEDVKTLSRRFDSLQNQVADRLRGIDTCGDLLHSFKSRLDQDRSFLSQISSKLKTLGTKETSVASRLNEALAERKHSIEDTCATGSRFIHEAKTYDSQCKTYNETLEKVHPSRKTGKRTPGHEVVQAEMDNLNQEYNNLLESVRQQFLGEAISSAEKWLSETEAMVAHQKPISADYNIAKNQLQEQRTLVKTVSDRQSSFASLENLGKEMAASMEYRERAQVEKQLNNLSERFETLMNNVQRRLQQLEETVPTARQFAERYGPLQEWLEQSERKLKSISVIPTDQELICQRMSEHRVLHQDIIDHKHDFETLTEIANNLITLVGDDEAQGIVDKLSAITDRYSRLVEESERLGQLFNEAFEGLTSFVLSFEDFISWIEEVDMRLDRYRVLSVYLDKLRQQVEELTEINQEVTNHRRQLDDLIEAGSRIMRHAGQEALQVKEKLNALQSRYTELVHRSRDKLKSAEDALPIAEKFHTAHDNLNHWMDEAESMLKTAMSQSFFQQESVTQRLTSEVTKCRSLLEQMHHSGPQLGQISPGQGAATVEGWITRANRRFESILEKVRQLERGYKEAKEFHDAWSDLMNWLTEAEHQLESITAIGNEPSRIKQYISKHKEFQCALGAKQSTYDATMKVGRALKSRAPKPDIPVLQDMMDELKNKWNSVCAKSVDRQRKLEEALLFSGQFKDAIQALIDWLDKAKAHLGLDNLHGDLDTVTSLVDHHRSFQEDLRNRGKNMASVRKIAQDLRSSAGPEDAAMIDRQISTLDAKWEEVSRLSEMKETKLQEALRRAEKLHKSVHSLLEWLSDAEMKLRFAGPLPEDEAATSQQIAEHEAFMREMQQQEIKKNSTISLAQDILSQCHPEAVSVIQHWISIIQSRWDEVANWAKQREQRLRDHMRSLRNILDLLEELLAWLIKAETNLLAAESEPLPDDIPSIERLIEEHQQFINELTLRQADVDKISKAFSSKRQPQTPTPTKGGEKGGKKGREPPRTSTPTRGGHTDPDVRHPKARQLLDKWRSVWLLAMERMRRLQDRLDYLREVDRVRNFDFDAWRRRFLAWNANNKARIMDFFRRIDTDNDGKVTQAEFIEGFVKSKFPTSRLEMERVAPIFDRNGDGYIDHKEYLDTLRPDRDRPRTEAEVIEDEVQRLVAKCTCLHRYKVFQVGEGKYRFGESQKLRLVRILRSTVMVRVGGGWVSLDEFLLRNDPCRAKGRTNVELREQFVLAEGVSQSMTPFISKMQSQKNKTPTTVHLPTTGPITKLVFILFPNFYFFKPSLLHITLCNV